MTYDKINQPKKYLYSLKKAKYIALKYFGEQDILYCNILFNISQALKK
jgi:hypothetical protein